MKKYMVCFDNKKEFVFDFENIESLIKYINKNYNLRRVVSVFELTALSEDEERIVNEEFREIFVDCFCGAGSLFLYAEDRLDYCDLDSSNSDIYKMRCGKCLFQTHGFKTKKECVDFVNRIKANG
jgi:hypothetical protein